MVTSDVHQYRQGARRGQKAIHFRPTRSFAAPRSAPSPWPFSVAAASAATGGVRRRRSAPPNLVLITMDTTRADHLGAWGYPYAHTPNLDALAARGTRFVRCDTAAPITLPSHATDPHRPLPAPPRGARQRHLRAVAQGRDPRRAPGRPRLRHGGGGLGGGAGAPPGTGPRLSRLRRRPRRGLHSGERGLGEDGGRYHSRGPESNGGFEAAVLPLGALLRSARGVPAAHPFRRRRPRAHPPLRRRDRLHGRADRRAAEEAPRRRPTCWRWGTTARCSASTARRPTACCSTAPPGGCR